MSNEYETTVKFHVEQLFHEHFDKWEAGINLKVINDLAMVAKYKGELAKSFNEVKEQRNTLISCMQEIHETQEELKWLVLDLIKVITGNYPESRGRITAQEGI